MSCMHIQLDDEISRPIMPFSGMSGVVRSDNPVIGYDYSIILSQPCTCTSVEPRYFMVSKESVFTKFDIKSLILDEHPRKGFVYQVKVTDVTFDYVTLKGVQVGFESTLYENEINLRGFDQLVDSIGEHVETGDVYFFCLDENGTYHLKFVSRKKVKTWYEKLVSFVSSCFLEPAAQ